MTGEANGVAPVLPSRRALIAGTFGMAVVAALIVFGAVLPAEYDKDPLGIGRATGLSRLWAPDVITVAATDGAQRLSRDYAMAFRTDEIVIPLKPLGDRTYGNMLEYKVRMKKGATLIYSLVAEGIDKPEHLYLDFHGHSLAPRGSKAPTILATYRRGRASSANGALVAPFDGIHGWLVRNYAPTAVRIRVKLAGYYELIPPGEEGNLGGIMPDGGDR